VKRETKSRLISASVSTADWAFNARQAKDILDSDAALRAELRRKDKAMAQFIRLVGSGGDYVYLLSDALKKPARSKR